MFFITITENILCCLNFNCWYPSCRPSSKFRWWKYTNIYSMRASPQENSLHGPGSKRKEVLLVDSAKNWTGQRCLNLFNFVYLSLADWKSVESPCQIKASIIRLVKEAFVTMFRDQIQPLHTQPYHCTKTEISKVVESPICPWPKTASDGTSLSLTSKLLLPDLTYLATHTQKLNHPFSPHQIASWNT